MLLVSINLIPRRLAQILANSFLLSRGKKLWEENELNAHLPLSKREKLLTGSYLILRDYSTGRFPQTFSDQREAYDAEIAYRFSKQGVKPDKMREIDMRKPWWFSKNGIKYVKDFCDLINFLENLGVRPNQRILEIGCGTGWAAELLSLMKFEVVGTTIAPHDVEDGNLRKRSIEVKKLEANISFRVAPMESVAEALSDIEDFDAIFVYEALHHAYDWECAIKSSYQKLKPGGWLLVCNEPNLIHTFVSYRIGKLTNTHEIGMSRSEIKRCLRQVGFENIKILKNHFHFYIKPHWIAAQKPAHL